MFYIIVDFFDMIFNPAYYLALTFKVNEPNEPDIIQLIKMNPKITQIELNLSRSTIKRILIRLRKGSNQNGYWTVKE